MTGLLEGARSAYRVQQADWRERLKRNLRGEVAEGTMGHRATSFDASEGSIRRPSIIKLLARYDLYQDLVARGVAPAVARERSILLLTEPNWRDFVAILVGDTMTRMLSPRKTRRSSSR